MHNFELIGDFRCSICGQYLKYDKRTYVSRASADYYQGWIVHLTHKKCETRERKKYQ